jgi:hypothetical protein
MTPGEFISKGIKQDTKSDLLCAATFIVPDGELYKKNVPVTLRESLRSYNFVKDTGGYPSKH